MPERRIVAGQIVNDVKVRRARQLRKEMTPAEAALWEVVRDRRIDGIKFRRQQVIDGFIVDFYCHAAGLFIEVDGGVHDTQHDADTEREKIISRRGLRVLRFTNEEILTALPAVAERITAACKRT